MSVQMKMQFRLYGDYTFINGEKAFTQSECYKIQRVVAQCAEPAV